MSDLLCEFKSEAIELIDQMEELLEEFELDPKKSHLLSEVGNLVDRVMGSSKTIALSLGQEEGRLDSGQTSRATISDVELIGQYAQICKAISYKGSAIGDNEALASTTGAFLLDATEVMKEMLEHLEDSDSTLQVNEFIKVGFLDRLQWLAERFDSETPSSLPIEESKEYLNTQDEVEELLRKMGVRP